jgi:putative copper export protein
LGDEWVEHAVRRVSRAAGYAVGILVITGSCNAYEAIGLNPARLMDAAYGRTLLLKLGLFAIVLGIGGYNRFRLMPAVELAPTRCRLLRNVALESALLLGVLGLTALLANTPPPHGMRGHRHPMMEM